MDKQIFAPGDWVVCQEENVRGLTTGNRYQAVEYHHGNGRNPTIYFNGDDGNRRMRPASMYHKAEPQKPTDAGAAEYEEIMALQEAKCQ